MKYFAILAAMMFLAGCSTMEKVGKQPELTPLGQGLAPNVGYLPVATATPRKEARRAFHGLWADGEQDFFRDPRAKQVGDVLTVTININDQAKLDNTSERNRDASVAVGADGTASWGNWLNGTVSSKFGANNSSKSKGKGTIDRKEKITLEIAAVVTRVLPNGNLIISGQQEMRVNFEVRVLSVAGIVRPEDITGRNTIPYKKIAEARVSYGGQGRLTEFQQPGIGQQIFDAISPL